MSAGQKQCSSAIRFVKFVMYRLQFICLINIDVRFVLRKSQYTLRAVIYFVGKMATLIHNFKYYDRTDYAAFMTRMMFNKHRDLIKEASSITSVPL